MLDPDEEVFVAYVASLTYQSCRFIWPNFTIISSPNSATELPKLTGINDHAIDLVENKQTLSGPVYKLGGARNSEDSYQDLANASIRSSKSTAGAPMLIFLEAVNL